MDELENEVDDLTEQLAKLELKLEAAEADNDGKDARRGSNQSGDGLRGPGGALAAQAMVRDRATIDKITKELHATRTRLIEAEDELRQKESQLADRYEDELAIKDSEISKLKRENRRLASAKGFNGPASPNTSSEEDVASLSAAQQEISDLKMRLKEIEKSNERHCDQLESEFECEIRQSYSEIAQLKAELSDHGNGGIDRRDEDTRAKDEEIARYVIYCLSLCSCSSGMLKDKRFCRPTKRICDKRNMSYSP